MFKVGAVTCSTILYLKLQTFSPKSYSLKAKAHANPLNIPFVLPRSEGVLGSTPVPDQGSVPPRRPSGTPSPEPRKAGLTINLETSNIESAPHASIFNCPQSFRIAPPKARSLPPETLLCYANLESRTAQEDLAKNFNILGFEAYGC